MALVAAILFNRFAGAPDLIGIKSSPLFAEMGFTVIPSPSFAQNLWI